MIRKMTSVLIALLLMVTVLLPVSAEAFSFVADEAGLFSGQETAVLEEKAAALNSTYGIHAVILTLDSLGGARAQDYADDYYESTGYGDNGVLFLLAMEEREWYISTTGKMIYALTDYGIQQIGEGSVAFFGEGAWYNGFIAHTITREPFIQQNPQTSVLWCFQIQENSPVSSEFRKSEQQRNQGREMVVEIFSVTKESADEKGSQKFLEA